MSNTPRKKTRKTPPGRAAATTPSPWLKRILGGAGLVATLAIVVALAFQPQPLRGVPDGTETVPVASGRHVEGRVYGPEEIPAGGPHAPIWQNCGFYDAPILAENATHALEHGAVWITYRPDAVDGSTLKRFTSRTEKVIVSPVPGQESPVLATAWARRLPLTAADDPALEQFVNEFSGATSAPEPGGRCSGGVGDPSF